MLTNADEFCKKYNLTKKDYLILMESEFAKCEGYEADLLHEASFLEAKDGGWTQNSPFGIEYDKFLQKIWARLEIRLDDTI